MTTSDPIEIKASVRQHYAERIQARSCCGPSDVATEITLYGTETITALPEGVQTTSFGCGNPIAIASLRPGEVVLDLGSGGGLDCLLAARQVGAEGYVYGLDMTDEMLAVARRNAAKAGVGNVEFLKGDIEHISLPDQTVSVIISNCVINLSPDKGQVLGDAFRVLKPGGRLAISDIAVDGELSNLPVSEAQIRAALSWVGCIAGALTTEQYRSLLAEAGFTNIRVEVQQHYSPNDLVRDTPDAVAQLPEEVLAQLVGRFASCAITAERPAS
jgi:ubiquinone/menaquinone biosynthesis C-methylase UbiE